MQNLKPLIRKFETAAKGLVYKIKKPGKSFNPVFIIGCGRSGTTILGKSLSKHPEICYLNERRDLWHKAFPELDIWSGNITHPKLVAQADDYDIMKGKKLTRLFYQEQAFKNSTVLLEKLPINNFRLNFLDKCFPTARYIYLHRNGLEVAKSISKRVEKGWYGKNNIKLKLLIGYSNTFTNTIISEAEIASDFNKGLFEWGLSMQQSDSFFKTLNVEKFVSLSYQDFVENAKKSLSDIFNFMGLKLQPLLINAIANDIERKNETLQAPNKKYDNETIIKLTRGFLNSTIKNKYFKS